MATHNWPGFGIASVSCSLDRPATVNRSSYTGVRSVATNPWHGKWSFKVQLATMQGDGAFQAARAFFTSLKGQVDNFHLPAVEAPQNANTGVTVLTTVAAGNNFFTLTGLTTGLVVGNMITVNGQLLSITSLGAFTGGNQSIIFEPSTRKVSTAGDAVDTAKPYALVALSTSDFSWDIGQWRRYGLSFDCDEAIGDSDSTTSAGDVWNATFTSTGGVVTPATTNLTVKDEGSALGSTFSTLNFVGGAVAATDVGGGQANITVTGSGSAVTLDLTPSLVASPSTNSAATINALIAGLSNGGLVQFPVGHYIFDGKIDLSARITVRGHGSGTENGGTTTNTLLTFPAGSTGFRIHHTAGQNSRIEDLGVEQSSALTTSVTASYTYNSGSTNQTLTLSAAGDFVNGQVVQLDGAGMDVTITGRLFVTTAGSAVVTWTDTDGISRGNAPGYNGMEIAIAGAGFAAGTTIVSWGVGTATLSGNAASSVSGAFATITTPLITEIISGGGTTTLTFADIPYNGGKNVTSRKLSHCAPGIYSSITCHTRNFQAFGCQAGMVLNGITTGGAVADNGTFFNSHFSGAGAKFGVVLQGDDAQVNSFYGCNFAGGEIGVLDQSLLGNYFYGCHWAFKMGLLVVGNGTNTQLIGGYMEAGTSYIVPNPSNAVVYGTQSVYPGYGLNGFGLYASTFTGSRADFFGPVSAKDGGSGNNYGGSFDGGLYAGGNRHAYFTGNMNNAPGGAGTNSGVGIGNSIGGGGGFNVIRSFDNINTGTMRELAFEASQFRIGNTDVGSQFGTWDMTNGIRWRLPIGYDNGGNGVGGAITQITSRTTGVTLNKAAGAITLVSAAGSATWATLTVTNSQVAANDVIRLNQQSGTDKYMLHVTHVAAGSFDVTFATTGGTTTEQPVWNFAVFKGANS